MGNAQANTNSTRLAALNERVRRHPRRWYFGLLYAAVTLAFLGMNLLPLARGYELVWTMDAQPLYANFLVWGIQALQQIGNELASGAPVEVPMFTYSLGYGVDAPHTFGSYLNDPINIIALIMPAQYIGVSYAIMTWFRLILASTTFSTYCLSRGNGRKATGIAALCYVCCGFVVFWCVLRHPKFLDWAILVPLVFQGADYLFEKRTPALFVTAMTMQLIVSTYYSYMTCLALLVYCLVKYFATPRECSVADFVKLVARFAALFILALCISAVFFLPQVNALLSQGRATSGGKAAIDLLFPFRYYAKLGVVSIGAFISTPGIVQGALPTLSVLLFLLNGRKYDHATRKPWVIGFALVFIGVCIPNVGHIMNGMGYVTDRWMLLLGFVCSYIVCLTMPVLPRFSAHEWKRVGIGVAIIVATGILYGIREVTEDGLGGIVMPAIMTTLFVAAFFIWKRLSRTSPTSRKARKRDAEARTLLRITIASGAISLICVATMSTLYCSPFGENWIETFDEAGYTYKAITTSSPAAAIDHVDDDSTYRYSYPRVYGGMKNSSLTHGTMAIDFYSSYYNQAADDFRQELGLSDHHMNFSYVGSDSRLAIEAFTGAKYFVWKDTDAWRVPFGYAETGADYKKFHVSKSDQALPLAFATPYCIARDEYDSLTMVEKQQALLQGAVIDASQLTSTPKQANLEFSSQDIDYEIVDAKNLTHDDGVIRALKKEASMTIRLAGLPDAETYLCFEGLGFDGYTPAEQAQLNGKSVDLKTTLKDIQFNKPIEYPIEVKCNDHVKSFLPVTNNHPRYGGKVNWVVNMGYAKNPVTEMTITFEEPGDYTFSSMNVTCQPVAPIAESATAMAAGALSNLKLETNRMSAELDAPDDDPRIAVFTVAYAKGWSAKVDGQPATVLKTDTAFLGVEVQGAGHHTIEWTYETPNIHLYALLTLAGLIGFVALIAVRRPLSRRQKAQQ